MARENGVSVGAHPSFADLYGFGRRRISGERPEDLETQIIYQIVAMQGMCALEGHAMTHVKTHGALGNMAAVDPDLAALCIRAVKAVDPGLVYVTMPYSETLKAAEKAGLATACEIYADRSYTDAGELTPRSMPGAVIHDPQHSLDQVLEMVVNGHIPTTGGKRLPVDAATLCVHGDTPGAVDIVRTLRGALVALSYDEPDHFSRPSIDALFESAADVFGQRLLGIILTGASEDGAAGLAAVKSNGGTAIAQDPASAQMPLMPDAARKRSGTDKILTPAEIADYLASLD